MHAYNAHICIFDTLFWDFLCLFFLAMQVIGFSTIFMGVSGVARTYYKYSKVSFFGCARVCFWRARVCFWCARVCFWFASVCCIDTHWLQALLNLYLSFLVGLLFLMGDGCGGYRWYRLSPILLFCLNSYVMLWTFALTLMSCPTLLLSHLCHVLHLCLNTYVLLSLHIRPAIHYFYANLHFYAPLDICPIPHLCTFVPTHSPRPTLWSRPAPLSNSTPRICPIWGGYD